MAIGNKYSSWYNKFKTNLNQKHSNDIVASRKKQYYKVVKIEGDRGVPIDDGQIENDRVEAIDASQARSFFLEKYPALRELVEAGFRIEGEWDKEFSLQMEPEQKEILRERRQIAKLNKKREEEKFKNAWYNDN